MGDRRKRKSHIKIPPKVRTVSISSLKTRSGQRRMLGYVLLFVIAFGATVETVHSHGHDVFSPADSFGIAAISDANGSHRPHTGHSHISECSMCAFQQQLFNALVHGPLFAFTPSTHTAVAPAQAVQPHSISITPLSGRGPPSASLL
jgi:hypothetical protein